MTTAVFFVSATLLVLALGARLWLTRRSSATAPFSAALSFGLIATIAAIAVVVLATGRPSRVFVAASTAAAALTAAIDLVRQWWLTRSSDHGDAGASGTAV